MQRAFRRQRQRLALRRIARHLRDQDPELARLLSRGGPSIPPPLHVTSIPVVGYLLIAAVLLVSGCFLAVASAIWWGLAAGAMA